MGKKHSWDKQCLFKFKECEWAACGCCWVYWLIPWKAEDVFSKEVTKPLMFQKALRSRCGFAWTCQILRTWPSPLSLWPLWQWRMQWRSLLHRPQTKGKEMANTSDLQHNCRTYAWCGSRKTTILIYGRVERRDSTQTYKNSGCLNMSSECHWGTLSCGAVTPVQLQGHGCLVAPMSQPAGLLGIP